MDLNRKTYRVNPFVINGVWVIDVVIDQHYRRNHGVYMNDELILELVKQLPVREHPEEIADEFSYFTSLVKLAGKGYRLIWLLEDHSNYIGIINAYRDDRKVL